MDNEERFRHMTQPRVDQLNAFVRSELNVLRASRIISGLGGEDRKYELSSEITRFAIKLDFANRLDLLVWFELEFKGQENAIYWWDRVEPMFSNPPEKLERPLRYLDALVQWLRQNRNDAMRVTAASQHVSPSTLNRGLHELAATVGVNYDRQWLAFLRVLYITLRGSMGTPGLRND